ncbi:non-ribosomal peptide synthetase [Amycolatopsis cihanbeyliensis]|uniref:Amino acid adenylation domain-containing protein n=1 Tax=Amycolatopsis cihanbeyliensis TaxID=1128664 RepID=A0A542DFE5_AMYCI|nr:non-ribosomal peptide synthetase [Amycolatopsis cihanbeyliensis]TQJ01802.1 amino acid adenylation domain-containing protein [Amycolatopsis cihanbeyliensis]
MTAVDTPRTVPAHWGLGTEVEYPGTTVAELIRTRIDHTPEAVAVRQWDSGLSYAELGRTANALAARLAELGVGPETRVGIAHGRSPELVPAVLGVLLAGGAYLPLDPGQPRQRLLDMLTDAGAELVLADAEGEAALAGAGCRVLRVPEPPRAPVPAHPCPATPDNAAYVLYTSGSTGRPKGVVVPHRSVVSLATAFGPATGAGAGSVTLAFAAISFDVSVSDLLVPLACGGSVALAGERERADVARLQRFAQTHVPTRGSIPVALLPLLDPARLPSLRTLLTGSEAPGPEQVRRWAGPAGERPRRFLNLYGPTETCVQVTAFSAEGSWDRPLPIGRPLPNHRVYVVDERLRPVPIGGAGELLVGGAGLARGYLGQPGLTASRFVPDPVGGAPGERVYRTGDLVRWEPDGTLLFLGRADRQVKIRGQRVEIGEVEAVLRAHEATGHCVVDTVPGPRGPELVAFVTPAPGTSTPGADLLRRHCSLRLPAAMVPRIRIVPGLPLTDSGKVDLARLHRMPAGRDASRPGRAPGTPIERAVATHWRAVLGGDGEPGLDDDFFACGGHSVTAMRLVAVLRTELRGDVAVEDVLAGRTLAGIAERVAAAPEITGTDGWYGTPPRLSPAQRRLWLLDRYAPDATAYNIAMAERLHGPLDLAALRTALRAVAARQEVLRWRIPDAGGVPYAAVDPPGEVPLAVADLSRLPERALDTALADRLAAAARVPFDLARGPLWRAQLYLLGAREHVLAITAHHTVFDGWSQDLVYRDLAAAYAQACEQGTALLDPLPAGFADYVAWRAERQRRRATADLAWWVEHLRDVPTTLDVPADRPRPVEQTFRGAAAHRRLDERTSAAISGLGRDLGATASAVLMAALGLVLRRVTGLRDFVVGTPAVDRRHADFQDMVGFFVEIIPLRVRVSEETPFSAQVIAMRDELLDTLAHPEVSLEEIVGALGAGGAADRNPVAQVMFNMFNFTAPALRLPGLRAEPVPVGVPGSPFDLTVYGQERDGRIGIDLVYNPDLFDADRMEALLDGYLDVLRALVSTPDATLGSVELPGERRLATPGAGAARAPLAAADAPAPGGGTTPETGTERAIAEVWCAVLGLPAVGATESFFEVGGTSMAAAEVQDRLRDRLRVPVRLVEMFRFPTVRALAAHVDGAGGTTGSAALDRAARRTAARRTRVRHRPSANDQGGIQ